MSLPQISQSEKYVTIDMWESYKDVANTYFPNATIAVDPFHVVSHLTKGFERLRVDLMKQCEYGSNKYYLLKKWHWLLETDFKRLQNHLKTQEYGSMMNLQPFSLIGRKKC